MSLPTKSCHNCRRRRLRCDRSLPQCHKCTNGGQVCLGYQPLLTWNQGVASRGKMSGLTFEDVKQQHEEKTCPEFNYPSPVSSQNLETAVITQRELKVESLLQPAIDHDSQMVQAKRKLPIEFEDDNKPHLRRHLTDPFFQDLNEKSRFYISYFNRDVCKDLVIYDIPKQNPFRDLIPLAAQYPVLLNIIVANSALNMANASQRLEARSCPLGIHPRQTSPKSLTSTDYQSHVWYRDALIAKQRALRSLNLILDNVDSTSIDVALGSVLLFTEFELADSGTKNWKLHMDGARALMNSVKDPYQLQYSNMSSMRRCLISNCLVYDVLSFSLANSNPLDTARSSSLLIRSSLQYAEANNYLSFPAILLETLLSAAQISSAVQNIAKMKSTLTSQEGLISSLLRTARSFEPRNWASTLQSTSPYDDFESRLHIASAHKGAVCIYISRILLRYSPTAQVAQDIEHLVSDIICHLSFVTSKSELFKATSWPTFVAGAEARNPRQQVWAMERLRELWECLPCTMGYIRSAMEVLAVIWDKRDAVVYNGTHAGDWIQDLKMSELDLMIA